jgi:acetylornithine deacetylase/succinyl-diaminopimelate desuccinylase family protein
MVRDTVDSVDEALAQAVHDRSGEEQSSVIELTQELVRFRSENPKLLNPDERELGREQEVACQNFMAERFRNLGMEVDTWEALPGRIDVVGTLKGTGGGRSLILNGHVDVVPAGDSSLWPHDPWAAEISDGKLWGRGSCDMKGGLAAGVVALRVLRDLGIRLAGDVVFQSVVDEETGGPGTRSAVERGHVADAAIVLEPTGLDILPVEGGLEWVRVVIRGVGGHSALRYRSVHAGGQGTAVSAVEKAAKVLAAVQDLERHWGNTKVHPWMPKGITTINPGVILGGTGGGSDGMPNTVTAFSSFPDYCSLGLSLKYLPSERTEDVRREFEEYIAAVANADPWLREHPPEIEWGVLGVSFPPAELSPDHPLLEVVRDVTRRVRGEPEVRGMEAVTDLAWLAQAGIPGIIYGPGEPGHAHGTAEYIPIDELTLGVEAIAMVLASWCGAGGA